jgi:hypothetical protein
MSTLDYIENCQWKTHFMSTLHYSEHCKWKSITEPLAEQRGYVLEGEKCVDVHHYSRQCKCLPEKKCCKKSLWTACWPSTFQCKLGLVCCCNQDKLYGENTWKFWYNWYCLFVKYILQNFEIKLSIKFIIMA